MSGHVTWLHADIHMRLKDFLLLSFHTVWPGAGAESGTISHAAESHGSVVSAGRWAGPRLLPVEWRLRVSEVM